MTTREATDVLMLAEPPPEGEKRPIGRPKGSSNRDRALTIKRIQKLADPIAFLARMANGFKFRGALTYDGKIEWLAPTPEMRMKANEMLLDRMMPKLRSVEHSGDSTESLTDFLASLAQAVKARSHDRPAD